MKDNYSLYFFALAAHGKGISGGDRIFIEFAKNLSKDHQIFIYLEQEGYKMCQRQNLDRRRINFQIINLYFFKKFGFFINYIAKIFYGVFLGLTLKLENSPGIIIYSASEFWMDSIPCLLLKLRNPKLLWVAAWFQTAPNPFQGFNEGGREKKYNLNALTYWLIQKPIKPLIQKFADFILVNNKEERKQFSPQKKVVVTLGGVPLKEINIYKKKFGDAEKKYDAVFQGRFHPQKGVEELVDIWKLVTEKLPNSKLVMIGDGPLMKKVSEKTERLKLEENIILTGYLFDGGEKYRIFSQSKIVVHPSFYDSGGMAAAEAMVFSLPVVGFDLESYKSYYPQGMVRVAKGNLKEFAEAIVRLILDAEKRRKIGKQALAMIEKKWSWDKRSQETWDKVLERKNSPN